MNVQFILFTLVVSLSTCKAQTCIWPKNPQAKVTVTIDGKQKKAKCKKLTDECHEESVKRMCPGACCSCNNPEYGKGSKKKFVIERDGKDPIYKNCKQIAQLKKNQKKQAKFCDIKVVKSNCPLACKNFKCGVPPPVKSKRCELSFHLGYTNEAYKTFRGWHSDQMYISSSLDDDMACVPGRNTPHCLFLHTTEFQAYAEYIPEEDKDFAGSQQAYVMDAYGSETTVYIEHNFHKKEATYPDSDWPAILTITVKQKNKVIKLGKLQHKKGSTDNGTHHDNGSVNLNYPGHLTAKVKCDEYCSKCTVQKIEPKCNVHAKLSFPKKDKKAFGRSETAEHSDIVSVFHHGNREWCGVDYVATTWGCLHRGDNWLKKEKKANQANTYASTIDIQNAVGKYTFFVTHWFLNTDQDNQKGGEHPANLDIYVNGEFRQKSSHEVTVDGTLVKPLKGNGEFNRGYPGSFTQVMECDSNCVCTFETKKDRACRIHALLEYPEMSKVKPGIHEEALSITKSYGGKVEEQVCDGVTSAYTNWSCIFGGASTARVEKWTDENFYNIVTHQTADVMYASKGTYTIGVEYIPYQYYGDPYYPNDKNSNLNTRVGLWIEINNQAVYTSQVYTNREIIIDCEAKCACRVRQ